MPRVIKSPEVRRNEILDAATQLFVRIGYEATTVALLIDECRISKGAFYHYFTAKEEVLQAIAHRMAQQMYVGFAPLAARGDLSATAKLNLLFSMGAKYKRERLPAVRAFAEVYCREENLRLRHRLVAESIAVIGPLFARILDDGMRDGSFDVDDPTETARHILHRGTSLHDAFSDAWRQADHDLDGAVAQFRRRLDAYTRAIEKLIGLPKGTLALVDPADLRLFLAQEKS
jgi:AcrR family transcriptional regulator